MTDEEKGQVIEAQKKPSVQLPLFPFDPSSIMDNLSLYSSLEYDKIFNKDFLERMDRIGLSSDMIAVTFVKDIKDPSPSGIAKDLVVMILVKDESSSFVFFHGDETKKKALSSILEEGGAVKNPTPPKKKIDGA